MTKRETAFAGAPRDSYCTTIRNVVRNSAIMIKVAPLKTHSINRARAQFSKLVERALAGEPQRVTRYGKEAVVIVSEQEWRARSRSAPTLGALLARYARAGTIREDVVDRPWRERPLGIDFD
jgi:prevent-host-death family protein